MHPRGTKRGTKARSLHGASVLVGDRSESDAREVIALSAAVALTCLGLRDTFPLLELTEIPQELWFGASYPSISALKKKKKSDSHKNNDNQSIF